jgi:hypothetical protein
MLIALPGGEGPRERFEKPFQGSGVTIGRSLRRVEQ